MTVDGMAVSRISGAELLIEALAEGGVDTCFANPGTSEMHLVAALDTCPSFRTVLCLQEGVVTGAADGYARMSGRAALTLLHLGPGLANGLSNMHNARRARSPMVNMIGDHATYHKRFDAPLNSDIEATARPYSDWVKSVSSVEAIAPSAAEALQVAAEGKIASLVVPADLAWSSVPRPAVSGSRTLWESESSRLDAEVVESISRLLKRDGSRTGLLLGPTGITPEVLALSSAVSSACGAEVLLPTGTSVLPRGSGRHYAKRIPYNGGAARDMLAAFDNIVLVGSTRPVAFFAYPGRSSHVLRPDTRVVELSPPSVTPLAALNALLEFMAVKGPTRAPEVSSPALPTGRLTPEKVGAFLGVRLPDGAIVVDESMTSGGSFLEYTQGSNPHDWLFGTGGSIGYAMGAAVGASVACPDRPVVVLESDGSGMYTPQALWSQAREQLNVTTLILSNRRYEILHQEMRNVGVTSVGSIANSLMDLSDPTIDWVRLAEAMGVPGRFVDSVAALDSAFSEAVRRPGPHLIEVHL